MLRRVIAKKSAPASEPSTKKIIPVQPVAVTGESEGNGDSEAKATIARYAAKIKNPKTAIRAKCIECSGGSVKEVSICRVKSCALWPFREGKNPFHMKSAAYKAAQASKGDSDVDEDESEE